YANTLAALSGVAGAAFSFNDHNITNVGSIALDSIVSDGAAAALTIDATAGQAVTVEGVSFDGGVVSGMGTLGCGVITQSGTTLANTYQPLDAELTSLAALSYVAASFVKMTGANTFALRTIGETADDLEATIDHDNLANGGAHDYSYISGNDGATDVSAAQLEELTDASETTLHSHAGGGGGSVLHKAKMTRNAAQSIPNNTWTKILFDNEEYDVGGIADSTVNYRFDIAATGYYLVTAVWSLENALDAGELIGMLVKIDGAGVALDLQSPGGLNKWDTAEITDTYSLNSGQYIEMEVYQSVGIAQNTQTTTGVPRMSVTQLTEQEGSDRKVKIDIGATADYIGAANNDGVLRTSAPLIYT
ncbi:hypothetical protein KAR91_68200, partial [Candidatus Pacearchaeota archaeon]|nr:hypothetical protein [Candidatus Pacearchaeota archaeon]